MQLAAPTAAPTAGGINELENYGNSQYTLEIEVGGQRVRVVPDTGSFALMVTSMQCPAAECPRRAFDPSRSTSYASLFKKTVQKYGSGVLWSAGADDMVSLGPYEKKKQTFREIVEMDAPMTDLWQTVSYDGILGLGFGLTVPGGSHSTTLSEISALENFGVSSFAVCFGRWTFHSGQWKESPSKIYWDRPAALGAPKFSYLDVVGKHHWAVKMSKVSVKAPNTTMFSPVACWDAPCAAVINTGIAVLSAPDQGLKTMLTLVPPVLKDCTNFNLLPDIHFRLGGDGADGIDITIPARAYVERTPIEPPKAYLEIHGPPDKFQETCVLMWVQHNLGSPQGLVWNLGVPFLQEYLVEYDRKSTPPRIAVAKQTGECPSAANKAGTADVATKTAEGAESPADVKSLLVQPIRAGVRSFMDSLEDADPAAAWL